MQTVFLALTVLSELISLVKYFMTLGAQKKDQMERKALSDDINKAVDESDKDLDNSQLADVLSGADKPDGV